MKTKKYQAETEEQVIELAKDELGNEAIVLSIKKVTPTGIFAMIKKPYIELIASYDETKVAIPEKTKPVFDINKFNITKKITKISPKKNSEEQDKIIKLLEKRVIELEIHLERAMKSLSRSISIESNRYSNQLIQFIYEMLTLQGVLPVICEELLQEFENYENQDIDLVVEVVYNKIIDILEESKGLDLAINRNDDNYVKTIVFIGTTGVGKTTTIAKLSSNMIMDKGRKVGFVTADTYRIAAVEQLKVYAEILGSQVEVVHNAKEAQGKIEKLKIVNNFVFFDTAGRTHKNKKNMNEMKELLNNINDPEIYLVISATSHFDDIKHIIGTYDKFATFYIIFTKIDETDTVGSILNVAYTTNKKIAYITAGQNVPNDIEEFSPKKIAEVLLGSMYK